MSTVHNGYIASLPWYDTQDTRAGLDHFWHAASNALKRSGLASAPRTLERAKPLEVLWQSSTLIMSQCCGPDLFSVPGSALEVIARPVFMTLDCAPGAYYSEIISTPRYTGQSARIAVNARTSRSGYLALLEWMNHEGLEIASLHVTGSHAASIDAVVHGTADLAAIDAHSLSQMREKPNLPIIGRSALAPAPPYVCHQRCGADRECLVQAVTRAARDAGADIGVAGILTSERSFYSPASEVRPANSAA